MFKYYFSNTWTGLGCSGALLCSSRVEIELSPYIYPLFKIATFRSNGLRMKDIVELRTLDVSRSPQVFAMELCCQFWCRDFRGRLPRIVFAAIPFPLDEILESSLVPTTVEYLLYFPLCFSINDYGQWVVFCSPSCDWVFWGRSKLHYVKHWMELLYPVWQF